MGNRNSTISEDGSLSLRGPHPTKPGEVIPYGASLVAKSNGKRRRYLFRNVTERGIVYSAGVRENDELISVNQHRPNKTHTVEYITDLIGCSSYVMLEMERKLKEEYVPFIVVFNVTIEDDEPKLHHFGFYWRTPLSEWEKVLLPLFKETFGTYQTCWKYQDQDEVTISRNDYFLKADTETNSLSLSKGGSGETNAKFVLYKYTPCNIPNRGEVPVIFVHGEDSDKKYRIQATKSSVKLIEFKFEEKIEMEGKLFFLLNNEEKYNASFKIRHTNKAQGTRYWALSDDNSKVVLVPEITEAEEFTISEW